MGRVTLGRVWLVQLFGHFSVFIPVLSPGLRLLCFGEHESAYARKSASGIAKEWSCALNFVNAVILHVSVPLLFCVFDSCSHVCLSGAALCTGLCSASVLKSFPEFVVLLCQLSLSIPIGSVPIRQPHRYPVILSGLGVGCPAGDFADCSMLFGRSFPCPSAGQFALCSFCSRSRGSAIFRGV